MRRTAQQKAELTRAVLSLNRKGLNQYQIAAKLKCSQGMVSMILIANGIRKYVQEPDNPRYVAHTEIIAPGIRRVRGCRY